MADLPICERLRGSTLGLCSEDASGYIPRGVSAQDCVEAADTISALVEALADALPALEALALEEARRNSRVPQSLRKITADRRWQNARRAIRKARGDSLTPEEGVK